MSDQNKKKITRQGKSFIITEAPPDHPIYKLGFVVGGFYSLKTANRSGPSGTINLPVQKPKTVKERLNDPDHVQCPGCGDTGYPCEGPFGFQSDPDYIYCPDCGLFKSECEDD